MGVIDVVGVGTGGRSHWTFVQRREWFDVGHWRRFHQTSNGQYIDEQWIFPFAFGHGDRARSDQPHHERYVSRLWCFLTPSRILTFLDSFRFLSISLCSLFPCSHYRGQIVVGGFGRWDLCVGHACWYMLVLLCVLLFVLLLFVLLFVLLFKCLVHACCMFYLVWLTTTTTTIPTHVMRCSWLIFRQWTGGQNWSRRRPNGRSESNQQIVVGIGGCDRCIDQWSEACALP